MSDKDPKIGVANVYNSNDYERGYREGYKDGLDAARKLYSPLLPVDPFLSSTLSNSCKTCGIKFDKVMGYVCPVSSCPSRISC